MARLVAETASAARRNGVSPKRTRTVCSPAGTWKEISPDLTTNPTQGDVPFGTVTALRESSHEFGTLIAGTDDGRVWTTRGGSPEWTDISSDLPQGLWISSLEISPHDPAHFLATLTGYRNDDFSTYVFASYDFGQTWKDISSSILNGSGLPYNGYLDLSRIFHF